MNDDLMAVGGLYKNVKNTQSIDSVMYFTADHKPYVQ